MKIAVASGKGGTGKTMVSTNLFNTCKKLGQAVTLIDCDAEEPNAQQFIKGNLTDDQFITQHVPVFNIERCTFCGKCQQYCNYNAIIILPEVKHIHLVEELCHDCGACTYACQFDAISEKEKVIGSITSYEVNEESVLLEGCVEIGVYSSVPIIRETIKAADPANIAILDAPPGTSCPFISTVDAADYVLLVAEPTPFGLNDLKLSVDTLLYLEKPFGVVINRSGMGNNDVYGYLADNKISLLAEIPFDREIAKNYSEGKLITDEMPEYMEVFHQLIRTIQKQNKSD